MNITMQQRDEQLLEMLAAGRSTAECAAALKCSVSTSYRRLAAPDFRAQLSAARSNQWSPDAERLRQTVGGAIATMVRLRDNAAHESTQLRAAETLVRLAVDLKKLADTDERLAVIESQVTQLERSGTDYDG